jgi:hypothetical protein
MIATRTVADGLLFGLFRGRMVFFFDGQGSPFIINIIMRWIRDFFKLV